MTRPLVFVALISAQLAAQEPSAQELVSKLRSAYGALTGLHAVSERTESVYLNGRPMPVASECEFAFQSGHRYFAAVQFYGVNDEETKTVQDFLKKNHYQTPVLMDVHYEAHRSYGIHAIPTLFIIDGEGIVRVHIVGSTTEARLRKAIESALNSPKAKSD